MHTDPRRQQLCDAALRCLGTPYFDGGRTLHGLDSVGFLEHVLGEVWGPTLALDLLDYEDPLRAVGYCWYPRIEWDARQPGDVVCLGEHMQVHAALLVLDEQRLIGPCGGERRWLDETLESYRARMLRAQAGIQIVAVEHHATRRLGVTRIPFLWSPMT